MIQFKNKNGDPVDVLTEWCVKCQSKRFVGEGTESCINFINEKGMDCNHIWKDKKIKSREK